MTFKWSKNNQKRTKLLHRKLKLAIYGILRLHLLLDESQVDSDNLKTFQNKVDFKTEISRILNHELSVFTNLQDDSTE